MKKQKQIVLKYITVKLEHTLSHIGKVEIQMKGQNLEELLNKKIRLTTFNGDEYEGIVVGYVPAQDNETEVEEIKKYIIEFEIKLLQ